jgi:hypothetical protein
LFGFDFVPKIDESEAISGLESFGRRTCVAVGVRPALFQWKWQKQPISRKFWRFFIVWLR